MAQLPAGVTEVQRIALPGGGSYVLGSDGSVYAEGGAIYYGGGNNIKGDTLAGQHQWGPDSLRLNPTGGYTLTDTAGRVYNLDTNYARANGWNVPDAGNTVTSDPAVLAFLRTSGLGLETAANQVRTQTAAINAARDTALGDVANQYGEQARRTQGSYESRGILRSSNTQQALDQVERQRASAEAAARGSASNQIASLNQGLVGKVLEQQAKGAELGLTTAQNQDYNEQVNSIKRKYGNELAAGGLSL